MRVTIAAYDGDPPKGGQGRVVRGMHRALEERGVTVSTVSGRGSGAIVYPRVTGRAPLDLSIQLNRRPTLLLADRPDLVHLHGGPGGLLYLRRLPVPAVYTAHHTYRQAHARPGPRRWMAAVEARAYRGAAMVLPVSESTAAAVIELGIPPSRIEVVPNGVELPEEQGTNRDPGRLLFVGRLEAEKGVLDAIAIMAELAAENPSVSAAVIGTGRLEADARRAAGAATRVEFLGPVGEFRLQAEYDRAAVVLMPSHYEGLGIVALEAMAAGAVVAGYDVDGLRDAVGAGAGGVLVRAGARKALVAECAKLLADPGRREDMAQRGRAHVAQHHSWRAVGRRLEEIYTAVLGGAPAMA